MSTYVYQQPIPRSLVDDPRAFESACELAADAHDSTMPLEVEMPRSWLDRLLRRPARVETVQSPAVIRVEASVR